MIFYWFCPSVDFLSLCQLSKTSPHIIFSHPNAMASPSIISMYIKLTIPYPECMSPVHCIHKIYILRVTSKVYFKELLRLIGQDLRLLGRGLGLGLDNIVSLLPFSDFCKANLSSIKQSINQWSIPTHHPLAGAYLSNTYHFKINMDLISFHSLMRALLNCLICSSSSMMDCSSHSIFLQISFILTSLFIFLLWLVSSNFFVSLIAFFWLSNTFASFSTCLLWLFTMASCFATWSLFCWGCCSKFQRPRLNLITLSEEKHPGAKCYIDVDLTPLRPS